MDILGALHAATIVADRQPFHAGAVLVPGTGHAGVRRRALSRGRLGAVDVVEAGDAFVGVGSAEGCRADAGVSALRGALHTDPVVTGPEAIDMGAVLLLRAGRAGAVDTMRCFGGEAVFRAQTLDTLVNSDVTQRGIIDTFFEMKLGALVAATALAGGKPGEVGAVGVSCAGHARPFVAPRKIGSRAICRGQTARAEVTLRVTERRGADASARVGLGALPTGSLFACGQTLHARAVAVVLTGDAVAVDTAGRFGAGALVVVEAAYVGVRVLVGVGVGVGVAVAVTVQVGVAIWGGVAAPGVVGAPVSTTDNTRVLATELAKVGNCRMVAPAAHSRFRDSSTFGVVPDAVGDTLERARALTTRAFCK